MYVHITTVVQTKLIKRRANLETWACRVPWEFTLPQFCHVREQNPDKHDHNDSKCDQARKYLENQSDAVSSKRVVVVVVVVAVVVVVRR